MRVEIASDSSGGSNTINDPFSIQHRDIAMFYYALLILFVALCVVLVEFFVPSAGILGVVAVALGITAIVVGFQDGLASGAIIMTLGVIAIPILLFCWVKLWPYTPIGRRILLDDLKTDDVMPNESHYVRKAALKGKLGVAKSKMLPSGLVLIDGEKYDAVSDGFAIEPGDTVIVTAIRGNRIYVEPYEGDASLSSLPPGERSVLDRPIEELGLGSMEDPLE